METINAALDLSRAISPITPQIEIAVKIIIMAVKSLKA